MPTSISEVSLTRTPSGATSAREMEFASETERYRDSGALMPM